MTMTKKMMVTAMMIKRKVHPARRARTITAITSTTGFLAVVSSLAWNTHVVEAANLTAVDQGLTAPSPVASPDVLAPTAVSPSSTPVVSPTVAATPNVAPSTKGNNTKTTTSTPTVAPAVPAAPAVAVAPAAPAVAAAPAAPAAPTSNTPAVQAATPAAPAVVYTCMSPGGKTENPTGSGTCKNARYGYVLTQI